MPQLNPSPWFAILVFSWLVFTVIVIPKTLNHTFPNEPSPQNTQITKTSPWSWPW
uniref:ATP synthase complex subunit 8 n=1 Tax=Periophthalmodon schlosseri TaxID=1365757 RepID=A0A1B1UUN3_PERSH|nr:ATP synthase F0 subunit 8 [Periophthalmodon schlosseri]ANW06539.1 ATP synthase F0 subunit 8 [Periophthalmodon schlosseri]